MPYRRLPNTDQARLRALEKAYNSFVFEGSKKVPFSENSIIALHTFLPNFQNALINLEAARNNQIKKNKQYIEACRKARMYISHYIQVMNLAISRKEQKPAIRAFYDLQNYENTLPPLTSDKDLIKWGKIIIDGDQKRIISGGTPFYNPSIAVVKVHYEVFVEASRFQKNLQATTDRFSALVNDYREEADRVIQQIWNEIEETFNFGSEEFKRDNASKYGVVYVFRKTETDCSTSKQFQDLFAF